MSIKEIPGWFRRTKIGQEIEREYVETTAAERAEQIEQLAEIERQHLADLAPLTAKVSEAQEKRDKQIQDLSFCGPRAVGGFHACFRWRTGADVLHN